MRKTRILLIVLVAAFCWVDLAAAQQQTASGQPKGDNVLRDLAYVEGGHERNRLDLYLPEKAEGRLPLIVWIHGGAWYAGSKTDPSPAMAMVRKGYAVASINYRLSQHAVFPAQIEDCKAAIRWLRANAGKYHLDPERIGVWGASAGGHLVALLGTAGGVKPWDRGANLDQSSHVQCVVDWFGPTELIGMGVEGDPPGSPVALLIGGPAQENKEKARKASPLTYVDKDSAPFLIMHGDKDDIVPLKQSELLAAALKKAGVEVTLQVIKNNGHGGPGFGSPESWKVIEDFFAKHLGNRRDGRGGR
jgi:acetyl esterase/lipase